MKRFALRMFFAVAAWGLQLAVPVRALDFTAQETWRAMEGIRIPLLMFTDPTGRVRYQPPGKWTYSGGGPTFALYPPDGNGSFMKFLVLAHATSTPKITDLPSADLIKWSQNYIAVDATEVKLLAENPSPFMLGGKPSREFIFDYKSSGQHLQSSISILDWNEQEHLAVVITALAPDFKAVHDTGISSLFSWSLRKTETSTTNATTPAPAAEPGATAATATPGPTPIRAVSR